MEGELPGNQQQQGNDVEIARCQKMLCSVPRFARASPWRTFVFEFQSWIRAFNIERAGDAFIKNALIYSMRGPALEMIACHGEGSPTYLNNVTWREYRRQ